MRATEKVFNLGTPSNRTGRLLLCRHSYPVADQEVKIQFNSPEGAECWYWFPPFSTSRKHQAYSLRTEQNGRPQNCMQLLVARQVKFGATCVKGLRI
ncbi:MAG: hypothetical protein D3924_09780 [Candidatus Electrothrix sp. AR4]|nr:hypothetical protein [Candidatus Electrothrix sp. AR4]